MTTDYNSTDIVSVMNYVAASITKFPFLRLVLSSPRDLTVRIVSCEFVIAVFAGLGRVVS
jgi:hypothetical protein